MACFKQDNPGDEDCGCDDTCSGTCPLPTGDLCVEGWLNYGYPTFGIMPLPGSPVLHDLGGGLWESDCISTVDAPFVWLNLAPPSLAVDFVKIRYGGGQAPAPDCRCWRYFSTGIFTDSSCTTCRGAPSGWGFGNTGAISIAYMTWPCGVPSGFNYSGSPVAHSPWDDRYSFSAFLGYGGYGYLNTVTLRIYDCSLERLYPDPGPISP